MRKKRNNMKKITNDILFMALGGLGEVGKNLYLFEIKNRIYLVDCGMLFPGDNLPGIDYIIPSFDYLIENKDRIEALFITHGHEDHIGAIPFLLNTINIKNIYASGIALKLIEEKLKEHNIKTKLTSYKSSSCFKFPGVEVSFVHLNHSIPDMHGIAFKTDKGTLFHTGDFKIDFTPIGPHAEYQKLARFGEGDGLLALFSDSTNAIRTSPVASESVIGDSLIEMFQRINGRIIIATFASNIARIEQILNAAIKSGKKIAVFGRSMLKSIEIALKEGYLKIPAKHFIKPEQIKNTPYEKTLILCTGTQGEPLAALSRIANGTHKNLTAGPRDTIIFSSSVIPGNTDAINKTINQLFKRGAEVITDGELSDTHTSGHGEARALKLMIALTRPRYFVPIHGEHRMQKAHRDIAIKMGVKEENIFILDNGEMLDFSKAKPEIVAKHSAYNQYMDSSGYSAISNKVIRERKTLSEEGVFSVICQVDFKKGKIVQEPLIVTRGFIYMKENEELIHSLSKSTEKILKSELAKNNNNISIIEKEIVSKLENKIAKITNRNPVIIPIIHSI